MCKACKMDPSETKVMYQRQGMVEVEDFEDEVRPRHPKRRAKKSRARSATRTPCPSAEDGRHVYIWEPYENQWSPGKDKVFYKHFGYHKYEHQACCGCKATKGGRRESERYSKVKERKWRNLTGGEYGVSRGAPVGRYNRWGRGFYSFTWEDSDEGYLAAYAIWQETKEAKRLETEKMMRRIEMRRRLLGLD